MIHSWQSAVILSGALLAIVSEALGAGGNPRFLVVTSPDGSLVAYVNAADDDSEIFVEQADGTQRRQLTNNDSSDSFPHWSPDGKRIAFASDRDGKWQIYAMDSDGQNVERLTNDETGSTRPQFGPGDRLAYLAMRGTGFKSLPFYDLIVVDGDQTKTLAKKSPISDFVWRPDGQTIVYGVTGELLFHNLKSGEEPRVKFTDIDSRLESRIAVDCRWDAKQQAVRCRLRFLGGQRSGTLLFGDDTAFLIAPDGKSRIVDRAVE